MDRYDIKRLSLVFSVQAEIEAMKAENDTRKQNGESLAYCGDDYQGKAQELHNLAYCQNHEL